MLKDYLPEKPSNWDKSQEEWEEYWLSVLVCNNKLCAVIDWFEGYGGDLFFCLLALTGLIFGIWWLIDTDRKLDEKYRYQIKVHHVKYTSTYRTNSYTMGDDYIEFYIKDDQEKHMIVMKGDNVTIVDHLNEEEDK